MLIREFCAENFTNIPQAVLAGVERVELCDNLSVGGTTPSYGTIAQTADYLKDTQTTLAVMIRPRGGNFVYNSHELKIMELDVLKAVEAGAQSLVFGAVQTDGTLDAEAMNVLMIASQGLPVTFHMAFDALANEDYQKNAIDLLTDGGVEKILLHGGPLGQPLNIEKIARLSSYAGNKIDLMIGGGVTKNNAEKLSTLTNTKFVHGTKIV